MKNDESPESEDPNSHPVESTRRSKFLNLFRRRGKKAAPPRFVWYTITILTLLIVLLQSQLTIRAHELAASEMIRDTARKSVHKALGNYLAILPTGQREKPFTINFRSERD